MQVHVAPNHEMPPLKPPNLSYGTPALLRIPSRVLTRAAGSRVISHPKAFAVSVPLPENAVPYMSA